MTSSALQLLPRQLANTTSAELEAWFQKHRRPLPWRAHRNPYNIWISEVMLQQTTVTAVVPYYERFIKLFPTLKALARAPEEDVLSAWSGLGYYSRARRLKEAAKALLELGDFPRSHKELLKLPGFGPYTSRAVSSLAFGEKVGVVDGNAIRVLTRLLGFQGAWWKASVQKSLQTQSDALASFGDPYIYNQALMELGATVCTPQSPTCALCPIARHCKARKLNLTAQVPMSKPRPQKQIWIWRPAIFLKNNKLAVTLNDYAPFLKGQWFLPGTARPASKVPKSYAYKHNITCYDIYVQLERPGGKAPAKQVEWLDIRNVPQRIPSTLIKKALGHYKVIETSG